MTAPRPQHGNASFWLLGLVLVLLLSAASVPSPLYRVYQQMFQFPDITLTAIYASYAVGGVGGLLLSGRLPDYLGRRVVLTVGLSVSVAAMVTFVFAEDVTALVVARILSGLGIGVGSGAVTAWLLDLAPVSDPTLGSVVGGAGTLLGLGTGALLAGLLVEYGPDPLHLIYWLLAGAYLTAAVIIRRIRDETPRRPGWLASMRPAVSVPAPARSMFWAGLPALVGMWALAGLYLALGPSLASRLLGTDNRALGGLVIVTLAGTGAIAAVAVRRNGPADLLVRGAGLVIGGVAIALAAVFIASPLLLFGGSMVAGAGLGAGFSAFVRATAPLVPAHERGSLLAAVLVTVYLSFSVPTIIAGASASVIGLVPTTYGYGTIVAILAGITTAVVSRRIRSATAPPRAQS